MKEPNNRIKENIGIECGIGRAKDMKNLNV